MDNASKACCLLKLLSSNVEGFGNLKLAGHIIACCPHSAPHQRIGRFIAHTTEERTSEEKCDQPPVVYLDGVKEWNANENLYMIGLNAWHLVKPYVSFFSHDLSIKVGTASPYNVHAPMRRKYLVWRVMEGFPHEEMGVAFKKTDKVWLRIPIRCNKSFQSLVVNVLGLFLYETFCTPHHGVHDFDSWNFELNPLSSRMMFGVECDEAVAVFFAGLPGHGHGHGLSQQFTSNFIIHPNVGETDSSDWVNSRLCDQVVETEVSEQGACHVADELCVKKEIKDEPTTSCDQVVEIEASEQGACHVAGELCVKKEIKDEPTTSCDQVVETEASEQGACHVADELCVKKEIKDEPEYDAVVLGCTQVPLQEGIQKTSAFPTIKCPGCPCSFRVSKSGLDALSHHILNSHKRHAKVYRHSLRFTAQRLHGLQSDRVH